MSQNEENEEVETYIMEQPEWQAPPEITVPEPPVKKDASPPSEPEEAPKRKVKVEPPSYEGVPDVFVPKNRAKMRDLGKKRAGDIEIGNAAFGVYIGQIDNYTVDGVEYVEIWSKDGASIVSCPADDEVDLDLYLDKGGSRYLTFERLMSANPDSQKLREIKWAMENTELTPEQAAHLAEQDKTLHAPQTSTDVQSDRLGAEDNDGPPVKQEIDDGK